MNYKKKKESNRVLQFFADKGFYIILILCIAAIGISGYVLFFSGSEGDSPDYLAELPKAPAPEKTPVPEIPLVEEIPSAAVRGTDVVMSTPKPKDEPQSSSALSDESGDKPEGGAVAVAGNTIITEPEEMAAPAFFVWPLTGQVLKDYSIDELVPSATMGDWRVHTGLDIGANRGTQVLAIADGVIEDVYTDEMMGVTVVVAHGGDLKSVYQNLNENPTVKTGGKVKAGDVLGAVGNTAALEELDSPHLHLEVIRDGSRVDPVELLPQR